MKYLIFMVCFVAPGVFAGVQCGSPTFVKAITVTEDGEVHWKDGNKNSHIAWKPGSKMDVDVVYSLLSDAMKNQWYMQSMYPDGYNCKGYASDRSEAPVWLNVTGG
jgi:hypothetical protein